MARKAKIDAEVTRSNLLDAAEMIFFQKGVTRTTLEEIAKAANVTRGALYWHFQNKSDILAAMYAQAAPPIEEMASEVLGKENAITAIKNYWLCALKDLHKNEHICRIVDILLRKCESLEDMESISENTNQWMRSSLAIMEQAFVEAKTQKILSEDIDPRLATLSLFGMITGLIYMWLRMPSFFDLDREIQKILDQYFDTLSR